MLIQLMGNYPQKALRYKQLDDDLHIVLLQDGIYAAQALLNSGQSIKCFAIKNDWTASGLPELANVALISHHDWVGLCAEHQPVVTIQ